jgi:hypothetical protein
MHPVMLCSCDGRARIVATSGPALYPDMVIRIAVYVCAAAIFALPAIAGTMAAAIEKFGLMGNWADDCTKEPGRGRQSFRLIVAEAPAVHRPTRRSTSTMG